MVNKNVFVIFVLFLFLFGCLKDPSNDEYRLVEEKLSVLKNQDCSCFVCTESSGGILSDIFTYNDLSSGGCHVEEKCTSSFLATFISSNDKNFLRPFDIGMGNTYVEYEESNLRSSISQGIVFRELKEYNLTNSNKYILPFYQGDIQNVSTPLVSKTFLDSAKIPLKRALEKNAIPIYYINSEHLTTEWLDDFFTKTNIASTPSFIAVKASAFEAPNLIKNINSKCKDEALQTEVYGKCLKNETKTYTDPNTEKTFTSVVCVQYEKATTMTYGCKSMVYVDYVVNGSDVDYGEIFNNLYQLGDEIKNVNAFLIHANITENGGCHAGQVTMNAANLSRTLMREYGTKPSYLILSIEDSCKDKFENEIAQSIFYNIYYMRMTGIMGVIYYDYLSDSSKVQTDIEKPKVFLQLNNYYSNASYADSSTIVYNKEPLIFDSDGYNISKICDVHSKQSMMTVNMSLVENIKISRLDPSDLDTKNSKGETSWYYVYAIPMLDYGKWDTIRAISSSGAADAVTDYMNTKWSNFDCDVDKSLFDPKIHIDAERCGVSNYLLMAYSKNNIQFNCEDWYDMIDSFVLQNKVSVDSIQKIDSVTMKQLAFAYAMQGEKKMLTYSDMRTYCYGSLYDGNSIKDPKPCNAINDYVFIRGEYLEYIFTPDCYISDIGVR